jgi:dTDP-4-amino-4,6-dideoxygalactose transaminase
VITASYSYIATANAIRYCGAIPVFVDIEEAGPNIDPDLVEESLAASTRAILCIHQMGMPCDVTRLAAIAGERGIPLIEDAACAIGSEIADDRGGMEMIGRPRGDIACFSFHPRKILTTGDGGMITTANAELDERFRRERQHGMDVPDLARHASGQVIDESHTTLGFNYRMTDVQAAIGRAQLTRLPEILRRRRGLAVRYAALLRDLPVKLPCVRQGVRTNWQTFWIELPDSSKRRATMEMMLADGISTRRGVQCAHREPAYEREEWRTGARGLARSERAADSSLALPLYHEMTEADQDRVVATLSRALAGTPRTARPA